MKKLLLCFGRFVKKSFYTCYNNPVLRYIWYGGLTTLVNWGVYYVLTRAFGMEVVWANVIAILASMLFAYFTNSRFVFESKSRGFQERFPEFVRFMSARMVTFFVEAGGVPLMVKVLQMNDLVSKVLIAVIVLILNYVFSKLLVFTRKQESGCGGHRD